MRINSESHIAWFPICSYALALCILCSNLNCHFQLAFLLFYTFCRGCFVAVSAYEDQFALISLAISSERNVVYEVSLYR